MLSALRNLFSKGKAKIVDSSSSIQVQQVELNEGQIRSNILAPQQYGAHSYPHLESDVVCLFKNGSVDNGYVIMSFEPSSTPSNLNVGDMMNYTGRNNQDGKVHRVWLKEADGKIMIETDTEVIINCKDLTANVSNDLTANVGNNATIEVSNDVSAKVGNNVTAVIGNSASLNVTNSINAVVGVSTNLQCPITNITGNVNIVGNLNVVGTATSTIDFISNGKSGYSHLHTGNEGEPTSPPI